LNRGPLVPQTSALTRLSYTPKQSQYSTGPKGVQGVSGAIFDIEQNRSDGVDGLVVLEQIEHVVSKQLGLFVAEVLKLKTDGGQSLF
jgi:hypothetical protein